MQKLHRAVYGTALALLFACGTQTQNGAGEILRFLTANLPAAFQDEPYSQEVLLTAGTRPYTLRVTRGRLPAGLRLENRTVSGVPTETATATFTLEASDANLSVVSREYTLVVRATPPTTLEVLTPPTEVRGEVRLPFTLRSPRGVRSVRATFPIPEGAEVVRVEAGPSRPLVLWDVEGRTLRVDAALSGAARSRADIPLYTVVFRSAEGARYAATGLVYELRADGRAVTPRTPATGAPAGTTGTDTPAATPETPGGEEAGDGDTPPDGDEPGGDEPQPGGEGGGS